MTADLLVTLCWVAVIMAVAFGITLLWLAPVAVLWGMLNAAIAGAVGVAVIWVGSRI